MTASFQAECVVLLHLLIQVKPDIPVLFIDTVHHFPETLAYRDDIAREWRLNLQVLRAADAQPGQWTSSTQDCCSRHKVGPLFTALARYDTWFTALRRAQSSSRADLAPEAPFRLPSGEVLTKASPLAEWTDDAVRAYASTHGIPLLPLYDQGFTSIGCAPCTSIPDDASNPRSGRWGGSRLECGIHIEAGVVRRA
jgi:phosphoadenosine phosphosulfate reductase